MVFENCDGLGSHWGGRTQRCTHGRRNIEGRSCGGPRPCWWGYEGQQDTRNRRSSLG